MEFISMNPKKQMTHIVIDSIKKKIEYDNEDFVVVYGKITDNIKPDVAEFAKFLKEDGKIENIYCLESWTPENGFYVAHFYKSPFYEDEQKINNEIEQKGRTYLQRIKKEYEELELLYKTDKHGNFKVEDTDTYKEYQPYEEKLDQIQHKREQLQLEKTKYLKEILEKNYERILEKIRVQNLDREEQEAIRTGKYKEPSKYEMESFKEFPFASSRAELITTLLNFM